MKIFSIIFVILIFLIFVILAGIANDYSHEMSYERGYLNACKDFYKGSLRYELKSNPDGSITWQKK